MNNRFIEGKSYRFYKRLLIEEDGGNRPTLYTWADFVEGQLVIVEDAYRGYCVDETGCDFIIKPEWCEEIIRNSNICEK